MDADAGSFSSSFFSFWTSHVFMHTCYVLSCTPRSVRPCVYACMRACMCMRMQIVVLAGAATMLLSRQLAAKARGTQRL